MEQYSIGITSNSKKLIQHKPNEGINDTTITNKTTNTNIANANNNTQCNILNLSDHALTDIETETLKLGLSFVPSTSQISSHSIHASLNRLTRSLMLRDYFKDKDKPADPTKRMFTYPSTWTPRERFISADTNKLIQSLNESTERTLRQYELKNNSYYMKNVTAKFTRQQRKLMQFII